MILNYSWAVWLAWLLGATLVLAGFLSLAGFGPPRGGPPARAIGRAAGAILSTAAGLMILWYPARPFGLLLGVLLGIGAASMQIRRRDPRRFVAAAVLVGLLFFTAWGLRLV